MTALCDVPSCDRPSFCRGYCRAHYARLLRHGDVRADIPVETKTTGGVGYWACHERVKAAPRASVRASVRRLRSPGPRLVLRRRRPGRARRPRSRLPLQPGRRPLPAPVPLLPSPRDRRAGPPARAVRLGRRRRARGRALPRRRRAPPASLACSGRAAPPSTPPSATTANPCDHEEPDAPTSPRPAPTTRTTSSHEHTPRSSLPTSTTQARTTRHTSASRSHGVRRAPWRARGEDPLVPHCGSWLVVAVLSIEAGHDVRYLTDAVAKGRESYYTGAVAAGEPPGRWYGAGAEILGLADEVDADLMEAVYTHLLDPRDAAAHDREMWTEAPAARRWPPPLPQRGRDLRRAAGGQPGRGPGGAGPDAGAGRAVVPAGGLVHGRDVLRAEVGDRALRRVRAGGE